MTEWDEVDRKLEMDDPLEMRRLERVREILARSAVTVVVHPTESAPDVLQVFAYGVFLCALQLGDFTTEESLRMWMARDFPAATPKLTVIHWSESRNKETHDMERMATYRTLVQAIAVMLGVTVEDVTNDSFADALAMFTNRIRGLKPSEGYSLYNDEMVSGLARAAAFLERDGGTPHLASDGSLWDSACNRALAQARALGVVNQMTEQPHGGGHRGLISSRQATALASFGDLVDAEITRVNASAADPVGCWRIIGEIAHELGVDIEPAAMAADPGSAIAGALGQILKAMQSIKNPDTDLAISKDGETLAQAFDSNRAERHELHEQLTSARAIVGSVAGALQVGSWSPGGLEIIQKANRLGTFKHVLKKHILDWKSHAPTDTVEISKVAAELEFLATYFSGPKEIADWIKNKPTEAATEGVRSLCEGSYKTSPSKFMTIDVEIIHKALTTPHLTAWMAQRELLATTFRALMSDPSTRGEFVTLMNLIIIPLLERSKAANGQADDSADRNS